MKTWTSTTQGRTIVLDEEGVGFRCPCGAIHRGPYADEDVRHHTCLHTGPLFVPRTPGCPPDQAICMECGAAFALDYETDGIGPPTVTPR